MFHFSQMIAEKTFFFVGESMKKKINDFMI